jgi:hypothetical protein
MKPEKISVMAPADDEAVPSEKPRARSARATQPVGDVPSAGADPAGAGREQVNEAGGAVQGTRRRRLM